MLGSLGSKKNINLFVGLLTLLVVLWGIMYTVPSLFMNVFHTRLGNLVLAAIIFLAAIYNLKLAFGLAVIAVILYKYMQSGMGFEGLIL